MPILPACSGEAALALAFPACPLPQRASFLSFSSVFSLFVLFRFLLLWFTPHRTWMNSVSVILYVCSLDAFLWDYFPLIGHCNQQQRSVRAWGPHPVRKVKPPPLSRQPPPPYLLTLCPPHSSSTSLGLRARLSSSETWEASLEIVGFLRRL